MAANKKTVLIKVSYSVNLTLANKKKTLLNWESTSSLVLEPGKMNCGLCAHCGCWTTDIEKADPVNELCSGATIGGKLLCEECLPSDHPGFG